jgi:hypothetical protein
MATTVFLLALKKKESLREELIKNFGWTIGKLIIGSEHMIRNKKAYYTLNYTWGIIMTAIGFCIATIARACGVKPQKHAGATYYQFGKNWGGISFGPYFFCGTQASERTKNHEFGHSL